MQTLLHMIWREKRDVILSMIAGFLSGLTAVALFAQSGFLISKAALMPPFYIILILTAFLKLFGVVKSTSKYAERYISHRVTFRLLSDIRMRFFMKLEPHANTLFSTYRSGDLLKRITSDVEVLQNFFLRVVYPPFVALLVFIVTVLFTTWFSGWIALVLLFGFLLTTLVIPAALMHKEETPANTKQELATELTEFLYGFLDLQLHHQVQHRQQLLHHISAVYTEEMRQEENAKQLTHTWNQAIALITALLVVLLGAYFVSVDTMEGLYLAMLILISLTVFEAAIPMANVPVYLREARTATARLEEITELQPETQENLHKTADYSISCSHVSFLYAGMSRPALEDISFTIRPNEKIAIIGPSGSGKSTLFQLLIKGLQPTKGTISINEQNLEAVQEESLWQELGIQLQHNHFFSGTIRDNLEIARPEAADAELSQVLKKIQIDKSLDDLVYEKGDNLSGGEKQRLAFARVLLRNSPLWLLDEPFTSIDERTAAKLHKELLAAEEKTVILITHKLQGIEDFDRILVMQDGRLIENGPFEELMKQKGLFYKMKQQPR